MTNPETPPDERDQYEKWGYEEAWDEIRGHVQVMPSFEILWHGYTQSETESMDEYVDHLLRSRA